MDVTAEPGFVGPQVPGYRLVRALSKTPMSEVYLAEETEGQRRRVALKVSGPVAVRPDLVGRFQNEIRIARELRHPNIVETYDSGESGDYFYLAMRYVDGPDLGRLLRERGALDVGRTIDIAGQIASALDAAHERQLIHRDVKPGNVLVGETGQVYLCDFGIAKDLLAQTITLDRPPLTPLYAAPEQVIGRAADRRVDVYALAGVIYHCLTGQPPFDRDNTREVLLAQWKATPPRASALRPELPRLVDAVLERGLAKRPEDRYASCRELVADLDAVVRGTARPVSTSGHLRLLRTIRPRSARARISVAVVAVVLVAGVMAIVQPWRQGTAATDLSWVPAPLRDSCVSAPGFASSVESVTCRDAADDATVQVGLFADDGALGAAYARTVGGSGVRRATGDCSAATGAEHRYPATGAETGRALCYLANGASTVVWTNARARTVAKATAPAADDAGLRGSWSSWVDIPAFPTTAERSLADLVAGSGCRRAPAGDLDTFSGVLAGLDCAPTGSGASSVSYYQFDSLADLRAAFNGDATAAKAPSGVDCSQGTASGFLGNQRYDLRSVDLGGLQCHPGSNSGLVVEWSVEPLLVLGRATGTDAASLSGWWRAYYGPPSATIVAALNQQSTPPFPTAQESALLAHIPPASRDNCLRVSTAQAKLDVGDNPAFGAVCGPTSGAAIVFYYQFPDDAAMQASYGVAEQGADDCTTLPTGFGGEHSYSRNGETGRLTCFTVDNTGERTMNWTDDRLAIEAFAFQGGDPSAMIDWWRNDAGPL